MKHSPISFCRQSSWNSWLDLKIWRLSFLVKYKKYIWKYCNQNILDAYKHLLRAQIQASVLFLQEMLQKSLKMSWPNINSSTKDASLACDLNFLYDISRFIHPFILFKFFMHFKQYYKHRFFMYIYNEIVIPRIVILQKITNQICKYPSA